MIVARTIEEARAALRSAPRPLGFVPTMGALHDGHLSLVKAAKARCAGVAASVFVNPAQFGEDEDYADYPRDQDRDFLLLENAGATIVFAPAASEMYAPDAATGVHVSGPLAETLEGASRPGHFDGMALVVTKLLEIVRPDVLFLGAKDAQQLAVVRRCVHDLDLEVEVVGVPTMREPDGLAMSSRNAYLTPQERDVAPSLFRALLAGRAAASEPCATPENVISAATRALLSTGPPSGHASGHAAAFSIEYFAVVDAVSFAPETALGQRSLLVAAARLGSTRLIDNISLAPSAYPTEDATQ